MKNDSSGTWEDFPQGAREQDYQASSVIKNDSDIRNLHMFFSPHMVPVGLTDEEIGICLDLHAQREKISKRLLEKKRVETLAQKKIWLEGDYFALENARMSLALVFGESAIGMSVEDVASIYSEADVVMFEPMSLPRELTNSPITREGFVAGVSKLKAQMQILDQ